MRAAAACLVAAAVIGAAAAPPTAVAQDAGLGFAVDVSLSPLAAHRLSAGSEGVVVSVMWYGEPTRAARRYADEMGQIDLGSEKIELAPTGGRAVFDAASIDPALIDRIARRAVKANVNVFSARRSDPNNLLSCDLFDDAVAIARTRPVAIRCKLIGER